MVEAMLFTHWECPAREAWQAGVAGAIPEYQGSSCGLVTRVGRRPAGCKSGHPLSLPLPAKTNVINLKQAFSNGQQGHLL